MQEVIITNHKTYYAEFELLEDVGNLDEVAVVSFKGESNPLTPVSAFFIFAGGDIPQCRLAGRYYAGACRSAGGGSGGAQFSAIAARGQGTQDNVYMVDDMPMFSLSHLEAEGIASGFNDPNGGRYSIFAPRVVDNVQFQNGGSMQRSGESLPPTLGLA